LVTWRARTAELTRTAERRRTDPAYIAKLAREDLGYVREGETVLKSPSQTNKYARGLALGGRLGLVRRVRRRHARQRPRRLQAARGLEGHADDVPLRRGRVRRARHAARRGRSRARGGAGLSASRPRVGGAGHRRHPRGV